MLSSIREYSQEGSNFRREDLNSNKEETWELLVRESQDNNKETLINNPTTSNRDHLV